ncbi:MAG: DUF2062 domain-containing protein [Bacteroidetes bacterium]|nr:DUF2062 domain-containing protein [Bacteroidota bacterium]MDA1120396.1 DUF2062 domain-containing protein [Bacteroidota bacterium]
MKQRLRAIKRHFKEVLKTKTSSEAIALGFSIGTFISILPTTGFGVLIGLLVLAIFKRLSKYGLFLAMALWNPLTVAPLYILSFQIGEWIMVHPPPLIELTGLDRFLDHSKNFIIGNLALNVPISVLSFIIVYIIVNLYKAKIDERETKI